MNTQSLDSHATKKPKVIVAGTALAVSAALLSGTAVAAAGPASAASEPTKITTKSTKSLTAAQKKKAAKTKRVAQLKRKYGMYPLPVSVKSAEKYRLKKRQVREIRQSNKWAKSRKARSVIRCESGGNYKINTGNGYYGAWQFNRGTWLSNGGGKYAKTANRAPKFAQNHIAWKTWKSRGWQPWACA